jgi:hypothetical protein
MAAGETLNSFVFNFASRGAQLQRKLVCVDIVRPQRLPQYSAGCVLQIVPMLQHVPCWAVLHDDLELVTCAMQVYDLLGLPPDQLFRYKVGLMLNTTLQADERVSVHTQWQESLPGIGLCELQSIPLFPLCLQTGIGAVKQEDVLAAASRRLHPSDGQVTVVVGDAQKVRPQLESAGLVVEPLELDPI